MAQSDGFEQVVAHVCKRLKHVLAHVERVSDASEFVVDVNLGDVAETVVRRQYLKRLPIVRFEALRGNRRVDDCSK